MSPYSTNFKTSQHLKWQLLLLLFISDQLFLPQNPFFFFNNLLILRESFLFFSYCPFFYNKDLLSSQEILINLSVPCCQSFIHQLLYLLQFQQVVLDRSRFGTIFPCKLLFVLPVNHLRYLFYKLSWDSQPKVMKVCFKTSKLKGVFILSLWLSCILFYDFTCFRSTNLALYMYWFFVCRNTVVRDMGSNSLHYSHL